MMKIPRARSLLLGCIIFIAGALAQEIVKDVWTAVKAGLLRAVVDAPSSAKRALLELNEKGYLSVLLATFVSLFGFWGTKGIYRTFLPKEPDQEQKIFVYFVAVVHKTTNVFMIYVVTILFFYTFDLFPIDYKIAANCGLLLGFYTLMALFDAAEITSLFRLSGAVRERFSKREKAREKNDVL